MRAHKHLSNRSLLLWYTLDLSHKNQLHEALKVRGRKVSEKAQGPRPRECLRQQRVIKAALSIREQQYIQKEVSLYGCLLIGYCHNWIRITTVSMKISYCSHRQHSSCDVRKKSHFFVGQKPTTFRISIRQVSLFLEGAETCNKRKIRYGLKKKSLARSQDQRRNLCSSDKMRTKMNIKMEKYKSMFPLSMRHPISRIR